MTRSLNSSSSIFFDEHIFKPSLYSLQEGSEKDDVVKDDIKQLPDLKRDPKKGLLSNGVAVSVCENVEFKGIFRLVFKRNISDGRMDGGKPFPHD